MAKTFTEIFPATFYNMENPNAPMVLVQFKKDNTGNEADDWQGITTEGPNNNFESMTLEDNGGVIKLALSLVDKEFHNLENYITTAITKVRLKNLLNNQESIVNNNPDTIAVKITSENNINLRVRFGYADQIDNSKFINETDQGNPNYRDRITKDSTVLRSPWLYFMITNVAFNVRTEGLGAIIEGYSMVDGILNRVQLMKQFAVIRGKPVEIIEAIGKLIEKQTKVGATPQITMKYDESPPKDVITEDGTGRVEIVLGTEDDQAGWRSVSSILNELLSKIPIKAWNSQGNEIDMGSETVTSEKVEITTSYKYMIAKSDSGGSVITFYYPDPQKGVQDKLRTYIWYEYGQSIVKNLTISSKLDFAALNAPIIAYDSTRNSVNLELSVAQGDEAHPRLGGSNDVTEALKGLSFDGLFVSNYTTTYSSSLSPEQGEIAKKIGTAISSQINQGVFDGTIELPGDPFYLFDENLRPYEYLIKIIVLKPSYLKTDNTMEVNTPSYLSGNYCVKGIIHTIDGNGFNTTLGIVRYPLG